MLNNDSIKNRTIFCHDNLEILRGIDSDCVDLIYLDPPFNKKKVFTAPIGSNAEGASFSDIFREEDVKDEWLLDIKEDHYFIHNLLSTVKVIEGRASYNFCYLAYMAIRLIECQRVLKPTGSIYLHCDPTMSHYLKLLLDCIFGETNFKNEIIWKRRQDTHNLATKVMGSVHDVIFWYGGSESSLYKRQFTPYDAAYLKEFYKYKDNRGEYRLLPCTNESGGNKPYTFQGIKRAWRFSPETMQNMFKDNMLVQLKADGPYYYKKHLTHAEGVPLQDLWNDISPARGKEATGYPTQKPIALLERIIKSSCPEGGIILDPFCGCATTCVAAEKFKRKWVGIDVSVKAYDLVRERMKKEVEWEDDSLFKDDLVSFETEPPVRTGADVRVQKYVYIISNTQYKGEWKVGIASDVKKRLSSYQTSDPNRGYVLEYSFLTPNFREIEKYIHDHYDNRHEWVREPDMQKIIKDIEGFNND